ncbi:MAG: sugar phosphate isomerase/epimerase [Bryobacterales bacterium]|nr:sugar phosphate isomerase/epimerase [Bryobacterales bacterium]
MIHGLLLHSVSYSGSWGQPLLTLEAFIDRAVYLGFDGVMLMAKRPHLSMLDYDSDARRRLRDRIEKRGLRKVCLAGYTNLTADLAHPEIPQHEFQVAHILEMARAAHDLGAPSIRIFTGYEDGAVSFQRQWDLVIAALREGADRAAELAVTIGVQNHHDIAVDSASLRDLILEVNRPNCRAMFDAWAPALQGDDIAESARKIASLSVHTTVANYQKRPRYRYLPALVNYEALPERAQAVPMDQGFIDYPAFFRALQDGGFNGTVAYEMCSPLLGGATLENLDRHAVAFLEFMYSKCGVVRQTHAVS